MPRKKRIGSGSVSFAMTDLMIDDLNALQPVGINRGNLVRSVINHLDEAELMKVETWPELPTKRGLRRSKRYAVSDESYAKVQRLRAAKIPVYDLIRHGVAVYLSLPHDFLLRDLSLLLDWRKQAVQRTQLRDRKSRVATDMKIASADTVTAPILDSLNIDRDEYVTSLAVRLRRGELGMVNAETLARRFGLSADEIAKLTTLAGEVHVGLETVVRPGIDLFDSNSLAVEARSRLTETATESVTRAETARIGRVTEQAARLKLEALGPFPNTSDEQACRAWLEAAGASLPKVEIDQLWRQFLSKRDTARARAPAHAPGIDRDLGVDPQFVQALEQDLTRASEKGFPDVTEQVSAVFQALEREAIEASAHVTVATPTREQFETVRDAVLREPIPGTDYVIEERTVPGSTVLPTDLSKLVVVPPKRSLPPAEYVMDIAEGVGYVRNGSEELIGKFSIPSEPFEDARALPEAGVVELIVNGEKQTIRLETITDEEKVLLGEALQDRAVYDLIKSELEEKFALRGDEPITEAHMNELYVVARARVFSEIDAGNLPGFTKDDAEATFARTMLQLRTEFRLPAFDIIDNSEVVTGGGIEQTIASTGIDPKDQSKWIEVGNENYSVLCSYCGNAMGLYQLSVTGVGSIVLCGVCLIDDEAGRGEGPWVGLWREPEELPLSEMTFDPSGHGTRIEHDRDPVTPAEAFEAQGEAIVVNGVEHKPRDGETVEQFAQRVSKEIVNVADSFDAEAAFEGADE